MKARVFCAMVVVGSFFVLAAADDAQAFELSRIFRGRGGYGCCEPEPTCCEPEPVHCAPEPTCCEPEPDDCCRSHRRPVRDFLKKLFHHDRGCCEPEPTCCEPEPTCCH
ncbi:MAG: hypothetical protein WD278_16065 [Pirellulales bacterium]